jgi:raffinose/stachyose/melibiose transport system substrate-binding protein
MVFAFDSYKEEKKMRKMTIKVVVFMLCLMLSAALLFAGAKKEEKAVEEAEEPIELLFWSFGIYGLSYLEMEKEKSEWYINKAITRYEAKNPNIKIEVSFHEGYKATEMLTATALSKSGPDVVAMWGGKYIKNLSDSLLPFNDYFTQEETDNVLGWENHAKGGNYYGAPIRTMVCVIFYNKRMFEEAGIDADRDYDGTCDSLVRICKKLKNVGITPLINGGADGWGTSWLGMTLYTGETTSPVEKIMADIVSGKNDFSTTSGLAEAMQAHQELATKGYYNEDLTTINRQEGVALFAQGRGAMLPSITFDLFGVMEGLGGDLGVMPMPSLRLNSPNFGAAVGGVGPDAIVITNYGKNPEEAAKFVRFLRTYEEEREFVKDTGELPNVKGNFDDVFVSPLQAEMLTYGPVIMFLDNLIPGNVADTWFKFEPVLLSGQMSVAEFLEELDKARDEALAAAE